MTFNIISGHDQDGRDIRKGTSRTEVDGAAGKHQTLLERLESS